MQPNRGLAGAVRAGLYEVLKDASDEDIIVIMDADDTHNPALIYRMVIQISEGSDIVIASRYRKGARVVGISFLRVLLSSAARYLFQLLIPIKGVRDYTCGYRAYRALLLKKMFSHYQERWIHQKGFGCMAEILIKARKFRPIIHELPLILRYDQKQGISKMKIYKTILQTLLLALRRK